MPAISAYLGEVLVRHMGHRRDFLDLLADRPELLTGFFRALTQQLRAVINADEQPPLSGAHRIVEPPKEEQPPEERKRPLAG